MYDLLLALHSHMRWLVLLLAVLSIFLCARSLWIKRGFAPWPNRLMGMYVGFLHVQLLLGLTLFFVLSPKVKAVLSGDLPNWIKNDGLRQAVLEHPSLMLVAVLVAQITRSLTRRLKEPTRAPRYALWGYLFSLVCLILGIPWRL